MPRTCGTEDGMPSSILISVARGWRIVPNAIRLAVARRLIGVDTVKPPDGVCRVERHQLDAKSNRIPHEELDVEENNVGVEGIDEEALEDRESSWSPSVR